MTKIERDAPAPRPTRASIDTWTEKSGGATRSVGTWSPPLPERSPEAMLAATAIHALVTDKGSYITIAAIAECIDAAMAEERRQACDLLSEKLEREGGAPHIEGMSKR